MLKSFCMTTTKLEVEQENRQYSLRMPKGTDMAIHISVIWLALFGLLMIASASMGLAVDRPLYLPLTLVKQLIFLSFGYWAMRYLSAKFTLSFLSSSSFSTWALGIGIALIAACFFPAAGGSRAWIRLPISSVDVSIQPSEFAKVMLILIIAAYCGDVKRKFKDSKQMIMRPGIFVIVYLVVVLVFQRDLGSMAVMFLISFICFEIPTHPQLRIWQRRFGWAFFVGVALALFLLSPLGEGLIRLLPLQEYQINRIFSSINPFTDQYNTGYQLVNGLVSFATGGWKGLGFGNSVRKYTRFPAANTDFILAIIVEELGIFGFLACFIPYCVIVYQLFKYAGRIQSERAKIILIGVAMYIVIHCLFNIGGVTGLIPLTGVPLLIISAGGSSTASIMGAIGIAQAVILRYHKGEIV